jgi:hypothetical protein
MLSRSWRHRVFGRRFAFYFWTVFALLLVAVATQHAKPLWSIYASVALGAAAAFWLLAPEALMPGHIANWQRGFWGEQNTQSELKRLKREGWTVRHDVRWGERGNHDHVVARGAVYVLNSKNVKDSRVTVEGDALRVTHLDGDDSYLADRWVPTVAREARSLKAELSRRLDFPVHVYPVLVIWGRLDAKQLYVSEVAIVRGDVIASWLSARPSDLLSDEKRATAARAVRSLPRA